MLTFNEFLNEKNDTLILYHGSGSETIFNKFNDNQFFTPNDYIAMCYAYNRGGLLYEVLPDKLNPLILLEDRDRMKENSSGRKLVGSDTFINELFLKLYSNDVLETYHKYGLQYQSFSFIINSNYEPLIKYAKLHNFNSLKFWDESFDTYVKDYSYMIFDSDDLIINKIYDVDYIQGEFVKNFKS